MWGVKKHSFDANAYALEVFIYVSMCTDYIYKPNIYLWGTCTRLKSAANAGTVSFRGVHETHKWVAIGLDEGKAKYTRVKSKRESTFSLTPEVNSADAVTMASRKPQRRNTKKYGRGK